MVFLLFINFLFYFRISKINLAVNFEVTLFISFSGFTSTISTTVKFLKYGAEGYLLYSLSVVMNKCVH